ncbi:bifunctional adenosylcobinamide kinase/adenosylcobinamide-phosphate guanylyltransferase [Cucumibacter marinus]|uniref:bifunctional adenosylcobinamide kinase/adenosylcobinamide-phosphate guanylyltransferase n=1 Tax=Cucumibacter marinus TaxID=1121252 RepID=UPI00040603C4|nr:bifunctional adenosylcobinamide kinase/adenosylcobinamide-phosphate guanylyltransferase [Cucumibacter marinus]
MSGHYLILGGARSGKSAYGEKVALTLGSRPAYLATGQARDAEMRRRIAEHQHVRDPRLTTIEEPLALISTLQETGVDHDLVLVDCLTLWITNMMMADEDVAEAIVALTEWMNHHSTPKLVLISNEVGLGVVPDNRMARQFRDLAGMAHQRIAEQADTVAFVAAGLPMALKGTLPV